MLYEKYTEAQVESYVRMVVGNNPTWAAQGLLGVYGNQTEREQQQWTNGIPNGKGFTAMDAPFMTDLAERMLKEKRVTLTRDEWNGLRFKIRKYAGQIADLCDSAMLETRLEIYYRSFDPVKKAVLRDGKASVAEMFLRKAA